MGTTERWAMPSKAPRGNAHARGGRQKPRRTLRAAARCAARVKTHPGRCGGTAGAHPRPHPPASASGSQSRPRHPRRDARAPFGWGDCPRAAPAGRRFLDSRTAPPQPPERARARARARVPAARAQARARESRRAPRRARARARRGWAEGRRERRGREGAGGGGAERKAPGAGARAQRRRAERILSPSSRYVFLQPAAAGASPAVAVAGADG